jgi:S1-C subfamily serine protease
MEEMPVHLDLRAGGNPMTSNDVNVLETLSTALGAAVEKAAGAVLTVDGRRRFPSGGVQWRKGVVVTANHTVRREEGISATLADGRTVPAALAGRDPTTDLAVLTIQETGATPPELGEAASLKAGHLALAVGRVDGVPRASLTAIGLLGGPWRTWYGGEIEQLIRLDRELHPTLSGGPLADARGRVLGINTSGLSRALGVTIPAVTVNRVVQALLERGYVVRGYLGLGLSPVPLPHHVQSQKSLGKFDPTAGRCLIVLSVEPEGPAGRAGVLVGDLVGALDGVPVQDTDDVQRLLGTERVGQGVTASIVRAGNPIEVTITVGERPRL